MRPNNGKAVNRYYQIDGLTPRGSVIATIFVKADNIAQVRALADYLFHNLAPYQARHRAAIA